MDLPVLGVSYKWNHRILVILCLTFHSIMSSSSMCQNCIPFYYFFIKNFFLAMLFGLWTLSSLTRNWNWTPAVKVPSPIDWNTISLPPAPHLFFFFNSFLKLNNKIHCMGRWPSVYPFSSWWTFGLSPPFGCLGDFGHIFRHQLWFSQGLDLGTC